MGPWGMRQRWWFGFVPKPKKFSRPRKRKKKKKKKKIRAENRESGLRKKYLKIWRVKLQS